MSTTNKIGPARATGNTFPHRALLGRSGWEWKAALKCWYKARHEEGSLNLPGVTITVDYDLVDELTRQIEELRQPASYINDRQYARMMSRRDTLPDIQIQLDRELALRAQSKSA